MRASRRMAVGMAEQWPSVETRRSSDEVVGCFIAGHIGFSPDQIDQRRHADMAGPFAGHAVVLGNLQFAETVELLLQQRARVEIFHQRWPSGLVIQLLGPITLDQQECARLEGTAHMSENLPPLVRRQKLNEDRHHHIELCYRPLPSDHVDLYGAQGDSALPGERLCLD